MKIRLMGTEEECLLAAGQLEAVFEVLEQSAPYPNRPPSQLVRLYLEVHVAPVAAGEGGGSRG